LDGNIAETMARFTRALAKQEIDNLELDKVYFETVEQSFPASNCFILRVEEFYT
jgi:hypothetical protein